MRPTFLGHGRTGSRFVAWSALLTTLVAAVSVTGTSSQAAPVAAAPRDPEKELATLRKRAASLEKDYRGRIELLRNLQDSARRATAEAERRRRELDAERSQIRDLAASSYMRGGPVMLPAGLSTDSGSVREAVVLEYLARDNTRQIAGLSRLTITAEQSRRTAQTKIGRVRREIDDLEAQRGKVKKLLAKYKAENPKVGRPDGVSGKTKSPLVGNYMTPRMRTAMLEIDAKFGPFPTIGCYRPGDPQDHGSGRACDFMESTAGRMPTASATAHGDAVAQYVISNAARLGIKYIIWRQRIWDSRSGGGWRQMEDRGGVTQNHYDHPHVSVF